MRLSVVLLLDKLTGIRMKWQRGKPDKTIRGCLEHCSIGEKGGSLERISGRQHTTAQSKLHKVGTTTKTEFFHNPCTVCFN